MSCRDDYYFLKSMVKYIDIVNTNSLSGRVDVQCSISYILTIEIAYFVCVVEMPIDERTSHEHIYSYLITVI